MKQIVLLIACIFITTGTHAQWHRFQQRMERRHESHPRPLVVCGAAACSVGGFGAMFGAFFYSVGGTSKNIQTDTSLQLMAAGGVLVGAGIAMIIVGVHRGNRPGRFTLISPRRNEAGVAYNF